MRVPHSYLSKKPRLPYDSLPYEKHQDVILNRVFEFKNLSTIVSLPKGTKIQIKSDLTSKNGQRRFGPVTDGYYHCAYVRLVRQSIVYEWQSSKFVDVENVEAI